ncbi:MAG: PQQ-binding-like beta-propeller repeat protein [Planctomycetota bacterium]
MRIAVLFVALVATCPSLRPTSEAAEPSVSWSRFRGSNGTGVNPNCSVRLPWKDSDVAWTADLPGVGNSSPIVYGDRIFTMSADPKTAERYLLALDVTSGKTLWKKQVASTPHHLHRRSSYASSTPCASDELVYFTWATPEAVTLKAFTHEGELVWETKPGQLGPFVSQHGYGASPALFDDTLILFNSQQADQLPPGSTPGKSEVLAFDAKTGEIRWKTPRTTRRACYGVPTRYQDLSGRDLLLFANTGEGLYALDFATGEPVWNKQVFGKRSVSSPQIASGLAIGTEGSGGGGNILWAVDLEGDHEVRFKIDRSAPYVPTPVIRDDLMFLWGDTGIASCVSLPDGKTIWSRRIGGTVSSSPVVAGDQLLGIAEDGTVTVLSASREFKRLGSIQLKETTRATPLVDDNYVLIRTNSRLICIGTPSAN